MEENGYSHKETSFNENHLEYLNQFLELKCSSDLLRMGLFPNVKEISESFSMWTALRQYIFPQMSNESSGDAIIIVGDGMTPRTGALCAFLTSGLLKCYSIDPLIQYDSYLDRIYLNRQSKTTEEHCQLWKTINGLRIIRDRIERVSIECERAIVVLMHAHVQLDRTIESINASKGIIGIITCPCCQWIPFQQMCFQEKPHHQYRDIRLLSVQNQINIWCFPEGFIRKSSSDSIDEHQIWGLDKNTIENILSNRDQVKERSIQLWPLAFSIGINAFHTNDNQQSTGFYLINSICKFNENNLDNWKWSSTTWAPKDILPLMKSLNNSSTNPSWFNKPVLLIGRIGAMRKCKHTIFYELNNCHFPTKEFEQIFQSNSSTVIKQNEEESDQTFPSLLKSDERIWTLIEYQRHCQSLISFDSKSQRNSQTTTNENDVNRVNILLSLLSNDDQRKEKLFSDNPQPRQSLFPWAISLRPSDILVAFCQLGFNRSKGPILCLIDAILLFDSKLHMFGIDRRILR